MAGGIPKGSVVLLAGAPGTMKSSLAFAALFNNAVKGRKGLYISLEQSRESLVRHMKGLGMDPEGAHGNLSTLDLGALRAKLEEARGPPWLRRFKIDAQTRRGTGPA